MKNISLLKLLITLIILNSSCGSKSGNRAADTRSQKFLNEGNRKKEKITDKVLTNTENSISICSWNLCDFGKTRSDIEIDYIANQLNDFDLLLIQEVVAGDGGADAIIRLFNTLNTKGAKWDYTLSNPTTTTSDRKISVNGTLFYGKQVL